MGLIIQDQDGVATSEFKVNAIQIFDNPIADITSAVESCKNPFLVNFNVGSSSSGSGINYQWSFQGATPSTFNGNQTKVTYLTQGNKVVSLTVTNQNTNCSTSKTKTIPLLDFIADFQFPSSVCQSSSTLLTDISSSGVNQWQWSGTNATFASNNSQNPTVSFSQSGNQTVKLIAINSTTACTDTISHNINVLPLPAVSFTTNKNRGCATENIVFTNTSTPINGSSFSWNFGDNTTFSGANPPTHSYTQNNVLYFPTLKMTGSNGCEQTFFGDTIYLMKPEAYFEVINPLGCEATNVSFIDRSFSLSPITNWLWDFGDGNTSTLQNPIHNFPCGIYDVKLIIQIQGGCADTVLMSNEIMNGIGDTISTVPDTIKLILTSTSIFRNFIDYSGNNFKYPTIRYGSILSTDFTYSPEVQCGSEPLTFIAANPACPPDNDIKYNWAFEGFTNIINPYTSLDDTTNYTFKDTLKFDNPMDVGLEIDFRKCISPRTDKQDIIYLKAPLARFNIPLVICNQGPGPHLVTVDDSQSIYGHSGPTIFKGNQVTVSQANDDVEVEYSWGDGTPNTLITDDALLEDADKGATTHVFSAGYGTYFVNQKITNHTTGCTDDITWPIHISFVNTDFIFDVPGDDSLCLFTPFTMTQTSATFSAHEPLNYTFILPSTTYFGDDPDKTFPINSFHIENTPGVHNVKLFTRNNAYCFDSITHPITIFDLPIAQISLLDDTVCKNALAQFSPSNSILTGFQGGWSEFRWNFNDNTGFDTTYNLNPLAQQISDFLKISLQVVDGFGCVSQNKMDTIIYTQKPQANINTKAYLCSSINELIDGSQSSGNGTLSYEWYLDNALLNGETNDSLFNTIDIAPPNLLVKDYTYRLIVFDNKNCSDTIDKTIILSNPRITAIDTIVSAKYIDASGNYSCPPVVVDFDLSHQSNWPASGFEWSFGNDFDTDIDSYNEDPKGIQYVRAGSYDYFVNVTESVTGCVFSRAESPFLVIGGPKADAIITLDSTDQCNQRFLFEIINASGN